MPKKYEHCANCRAELGNEYYSFQDNFLQVKYFEESDGSDNAFCSRECACNTMMLETMENKEESR